MTSVYSRSLHGDRHKRSFTRRNLTDDRSVIELLVSRRRAQKRTVAQTGGQRREHRCSRPTHPQHHVGFKKTKNTKPLEMMGVGMSLQFVMKNIKIGVFCL